VKGRDVGSRVGVQPFGFGRGRTLFGEVSTIDHQSGGRGGIRTHGRIAPTPDFESGAFDQLSHPSVESKQGGEDILKDWIVDDLVADAAPVTKWIQASCNLQILGKSGRRKVVPYDSD
jgi:hypothetical protein